MSNEIQKALGEMEARIIAVVRQELNPKEVEEKRYAKKLHDTKLLLKNYNKFKKHADQSDITIKSLIDEELLDMLGEEYEHDEQYIYSIIRTKERTVKMLYHINRVLEFFEYSTKEEYRLNRIAKVLIMKYIENKSQSEIAMLLSVDDRTVRRDIDEGIEEIAPLLFGIDGVKLS